MKKTINLSIIYAYFNTPKELLGSVRSIPSAAGNISYEVIIVDNKSTKLLSGKIQEFNFVRIVKNERNFGYGKALNVGAKLAKGKILLLVNPDTIFEKKSIYILYSELLKNNKAGICSPQLLSEKGTVLQNISLFPTFFKSIIIFSFLRSLSVFKKIIDGYYMKGFSENTSFMVETVGGACLMIRKSIFQKIKGFDERFFLYFEEDDLCFRVRKEGYEIIHQPKARVVHLVARSQGDKEKIELLFEESRLKFFVKYFGLLRGFLLEIILRLLKRSSIILSLILVFSLFLNLYRINSEMMFIGDMGRDLLVARDMVINGNIPLVGIPSSVAWLHQGPLSIYIIGLALIMGKFNPVAPAIAYALLGALATFFIYKLGKLYFNRKVGLISSLFFATSPLILVNERMPYHTAPIPFFSILFFYILFKILSGSVRLLPVLLLLLGLLLQLELSNVVLIFILIIVSLLFRPAFSIRTKILGLVSFLLGILPFLLYDISHKFIQTGGFFLWVLNRTRLFFGLTQSGNSTFAHLPSAIQTITDQIVGILFPASPWIALSLVFLAIIVVYGRKVEVFNLKNKGLVLLLVWVIVSLIGYSVHAAPGTAYFPLIFGGISILISYSIFIFSKRFSVIYLAFIFLCFFNGFYTVSNNYFLNTESGIHTLPPSSYNFGPSFTVREEVADFIIADAKGGSIQLKRGGFLSTVKTGIDNYTYLILWKKGNLSESGTIAYTIYDGKKDIKNLNSIVYHNQYVWVTKNEAN